MIFYATQGHPTKYYGGEVEYPHIYFRKEEWDDYGYTCLYSVFYNDTAGEWHELPQVRIVQSGELNTVLPERFVQLPDGYYSLGINLGYYEAMAATFGDMASRVLEKLNDVAFSLDKRTEAEKITGYWHSLKRERTAHRAERYGRQAVFGWQEEEGDLQFTYRQAFPFAESISVSLDFDFGQKVVGVPHRVYALIGKNGTGKTQTLTRIARDLGLREEDWEGEFLPELPLFDQVFGVSYSAFDDFEKPSNHKDFSYHYCGLMGQDDGRLLSVAERNKKLGASLVRIAVRAELSAWRELMEQVIPEEELSVIWNMQEDLADRKAPLPGLSSGQAYLLMAFSEVIAHIRPKSLILFDEPEMHLHPEAVSQVIGMLHDLTKRYDSYAIVATHSPIVLQELPRRCVHVLSRDLEDGSPQVRPLGAESFGENLHAITREVFDTYGSTYYQRVFERLVQAERMSYDQIMEAFDGQLGLHARLLLTQLTNEPNRDV